MKANTPKEAYNIVSVFLSKKKEKDAETAFKKHQEALMINVGVKYSDSVQLMIKAYYNIEDYVADGESMDILYDLIETNS